MADRRYKLIGKGLVGDCDFLVEDLANGEYIQWNSTAEKWQNVTISQTPDALYWNGVDIKVQTNSGGIDVTGDIVATSHIEAGKGTGSVAMTVNDGYGNANIAFNHWLGSPDVTGSSGRIECTVDSASGSMTFEVKDSTTAGVPVSLVECLKLTETVQTMYVSGDNLLEIRENHIRLIGTNSDQPYYTFYNQAETRLGYIQTTTGDLRIIGEQHGANVYIAAENNVGSLVELWEMDPDAALLNSNLKECFDVSDSWLRLNQNGDFTSGTYTPGRIRCDSYITFFDTDTVQAAGGDYGTINTTGTNAWDGWVIENRHNFMANGTDGRLYNDNNNENYAQFLENSVFRLYGDNIEAIECTTSGEVLIDSLGAAAHHADATLVSGDITVSTAAPSGGSNGNIWFRY